MQWKSLCALILGQLLVKYGLLEAFDVAVTLDGIGIGLLALSTACIGASGAIIHAIYNIPADKINAPQQLVLTTSIPLKKANKLFFICTIVGVLIGFYLANIIDHPSFVILFILSSALLYARATSLKKYPLLSPLIISALMGLSILSVGLFDLFPAITSQNRGTLTTFFKIIIDYAILIGILNFIRMLIVHQMNIDGDYNTGRKTLSILLGKERMNKLIFALNLIPVLGVIFYITNYLYYHNITLIYAILLLVAPLTYVNIKVINAKSRQDYKRLSHVLEFTMICAILSIGLYQLILK